ncbi:MAG: hypothetical protein WC389_17070 [Lutibacter sp.]|jgi:hypothetical protein
MNKNTTVYKNPKWFNPINQVQTELDETKIWKDVPSWQEKIHNAILAKHFPEPKSPNFLQKLFKNKQ